MLKNITRQLFAQLSRHCRADWFSAIRYLMPAIWPLRRFRIRWVNTA